MSILIESHFVAVGGIEPHSLRNYLYNSFHILEFPPNHFVNHAHVALDYLHDFRADVFVGVVWNRCAVVAVSDQFYCSFH